LRLFDDGGQISPDAVGNMEQQFHGRVAQSPLNQAQHGLRHARTLGDGIARKFPAFAFHTEDIGGRRNSIIIPSTGLSEFKKLLEEMIKASDELPSGKSGVSDESH